MHGLLGAKGPLSGAVPSPGMQTGQWTDSAHYRPIRRTRLGLLGAKALGLLGAEARPIRRTDRRIPPIDQLVVRRLTV
jgi:hypothetical protein